MFSALRDLQESMLLSNYLKNKIDCMSYLFEAMNMNPALKLLEKALIQKGPVKCKWSLQVKF